MFDIVPGIFALFTLVIVIFIAEYFGRARTPRQPRQTMVMVEVQPEAPPQPEGPSDEDKETQHWTALGLHKLGYSLPEGRRMAATAPAGLGLQDSLQWCLRQRGAKK